MIDISVLKSHDVLFTIIKLIVGLVWTVWGWILMFNYLEGKYQNRKSALGFSMFFVMLGPVWLSAFLIDVGFYDFL